MKSAAVRAAFSAGPAAAGQVLSHGVWAAAVRGALATLAATLPGGPRWGGEYC